jgi:transposase InsO family protein
MGDSFSYIHGKEGCAMPWAERSPMDERTQFIAAVLAGEESFAAICRQYGISRKTGYKWWKRYQADGASGLVERSRAPQTSPQAMEAALAEQLLAFRAKHPTWGPRKLLARLEQQDPTQVWPAASTVGDLLRRSGLTAPRRRRPHASPTPDPLTEMTDANVVWTLDFKGQFRTGDGVLCYPLTLSDGFSRYLLRCQALPKADGAQARPIMEAAFREYGLPLVIRTDNGEPFASTGLAGLSRLAVWWIKLGITPERIDPGQPSQNGRHERMHRTLKAETTQPPAATLRAQQLVFLRFQQEYNEERPHEALGQIPPAALYEPSPRPYPDRIVPFAYPTADLVKRVRSNGELYWHGQYIYLSKLLAGEPVGCCQQADGQWRVWFGPLELGVVDEARGTISPPDRAGRGRPGRETTDA